MADLGGLTKKRNKTKPRTNNKIVNNQEASDLLKSSEEPKSADNTTHDVTSTTSDNITDSKDTVAEKLKDLNFKVPSTFHTDFKTYASLNGMKMRDLLEKMYQFYTSHH